MAYPRLFEARRFRKPNTSPTKTYAASPTRFIITPAILTSGIWNMSKDVECYFFFLSHRRRNDGVKSITIGGCGEKKHKTPQRSFCTPDAKRQTRMNPARAFGHRWRTGIEKTSWTTAKTSTSTQEAKSTQWSLVICVSQTSLAQRRLRDSSLANRKLQRPSCARTRPMENGRIRA